MQMFNAEPAGGCRPGVEARGSLCILYERVCVHGGVRVCVTAFEGNTSSSHNAQDIDWFQFPPSWQPISATTLNKGAYCAAALL